MLSPLVLLSVSAAEPAEPQPEEQQQPPKKEEKPEESATCIEDPDEQGASPKASKDPPPKNVGPRMFGGATPFPENSGAQGDFCRSGKKMLLIEESGKKGLFGLLAG